MYADLTGNAFCVISHMCNLDNPLHVHGCCNGRCLMLIQTIKMHLDANSCDQICQLCDNTTTTHPMMGHM